MIFDPRDPNPFKLSRSKLESFIRCPRCFYLDRRHGVIPPPGPPFSLNSAVDFLLKKEFDQHRRKKTPHPLMEEYGIKAIPFAHPRLDEWRNNFVGVSFLHQPTKLLMSGAIDDLWVNAAGEIFVVDYKATSKDSEVNLDAEWQSSYKNQLEIYQWLLRQNGLAISNLGYFVYLNGRRDRDALEGRLEFKAKIIPYQGDNSWIEKTIFAAKQCLLAEELPAPAPACPFCRYRRLARLLESTF